MRSTAERFETKYIPEPMSGCWLWTGSQRHRGYGAIRIGGKLECAHRISWQLYQGDLPEELDVLHRCDNPSCVNPGHLFLGTAVDNAVDMVSKNRHNPAVGERQHLSKLNEALVRMIRASDKSGYALARELGIDTGTIYSVRHNRTWKHVQ